MHALMESAYGRLFRLIATLGVPPAFIVVLEVAGRRSGKSQSVVVVLADHDGEQYVVSVLGEESDWLRNVRAAHGDAVIRHGRRRKVRLEELPPERRAPVLKAYVQRAIGGRPLFAVDHRAPVAEFEGIAGQHVALRIVNRGG